MKNKNIFLLLIFSLFSQVISLHATHIRGGEVKLQLVNCNSLSITATIILYRNVSTPEDIQVGGGIVDFGDGITIVIPEGGFTKTYIGNEVERNAYTLEHTYSSLGSYNVGYVELNRNGGIINMTNSVTTPFYINSNIVLDSFLGCASSTPDFLSDPIFEFSISDIIEYSFAATSIDDNKLRYSIVTPKQGIGTIAEGFYLPDNISIDTLSGMFRWDTSKGRVLEGEYSFAVKVSQFREMDGVYYQFGYNVRDVQLILNDTNSTLSVSDDLVVSNMNRMLLESDDEVNVVISLTDGNSTENFFEVLSELSASNLVFETISNSSTESELIVTILSNDNIVRDNPYIITVRATSIYVNGQINYKDRNYVIYTKNIIEPNLITANSNRLVMKNRYVYPVPASQYIYLFNEKYDDIVSLYTLQGKLIKKENIGASKCVWVGDLSEGKYLVVTSDEIVYRVVIDN